MHEEITCICVYDDKQATGRAGRRPSPLAPPVRGACCQKGAEHRAEECFPSGSGQGLSPVVDLLGDGVAVLGGIYGRWRAQRDASVQDTREPGVGDALEESLPSPGPCLALGVPAQFLT